MITIGLVGLGKMGTGLASRWLQAHYKVIGYDVAVRSHSFTSDKLGTNFIIVDTLEKLAQQARVIWLMIPAGQPVTDVIEKLLPFLKPRDIIIDGGNSYFEDSRCRYVQLKKEHISFLDCGVSGGILGYEEGLSLMIGGDNDAYNFCKDIFKALAAPEGYGYVGPSGAGHYVKMIHNGIEYALMESYAEGFHLLKEGTYQQLDLELISKIWNNGAIIRSLLLKYIEKSMHQDQDLKNISGVVDISGMVGWAVQEAHKKNIPFKLIEDALKIREQSHHTEGNYATKIVAMLRHIFGGHKIYFKDSKK